MIGRDPARPVAVLVVVDAAPETLTRMEDGLNGSSLDWCRPLADLGEGTWDLVLLSNAARTPDMVDWVAREVKDRVREGGKYQWRDKGTP